MAIENDDATGSSENQEAQENQGENRQPTFTQEDVNRLLAKNKRELREELEKLRNENNGYKEEIGNFKQFQKSMEESMERAGLRFGKEGLEIDEEDDDPDNFLDDYANPPKGVNPDFWRKYKKFEVGSSRMMEELAKSKDETNSKIDTLLKQIDEERNIRKQAEDRAREIERGQLLMDALQKANCIDLEGGRRYFKDQTVWVEGRGWMFAPRGAQDPEDYVALENGIKKEIPDYLKRSAVSNGGSGTTGSRGSESITDLKAMQQTVDELGKRASRTGNPADIARYTSAKRELNKELANRGIGQ